jgi:hypothetical protein
MDPFDDDAIELVVLVNERGEYSFWRAARSGTRQGGVISNSRSVFATAFQDIELTLEAVAEKMTAQAVRQASGRTH